MDINAVGDCSFSSVEIERSLEYNSGWREVREDRVDKGGFVWQDGLKSHQ